MKWALLDAKSGTVLATRGEAYEDSVLGAYVEAPDEVQPGWEKAGEEWRKGAVLLTKEAADVAEDGVKADVETKLEQAEGLLARLDAGTATLAECRPVIAFLVREAVRRRVG